jgi:hypothetical protein
VYGVHVIHTHGRLFLSDTPDTSCFCPIRRIRVVFVQYVGYELIIFKCCISSNFAFFCFFFFVFCYLLCFVFLYVVQNLSVGSPVRVERSRSLSPVAGHRGFSFGRVNLGGRFETFGITASTGFMPTISAGAAGGGGGGGGVGGNNMTGNANGGGGGGSFNNTGNFSNGA